jgi:hypothetical protein
LILFSRVILLSSSFLQAASGRRKGAPPKSHEIL